MGSQSCRARRVGIALAVTTVVLAAAAAPALASFPYTRPGGNPVDFTDLYLANQVPNDLSGDSNDWKFAATPDSSNNVDNNRPTELGGVRGAHIVDASSTANTAWKLTLGRPDVEIAVLDSGIKWNDPGAMSDLRLKIHLNEGELPLPEHADGSTCSAYDCNGDGVFNVADYANDPRINLNDPRRNGPPGVLTPEDLIIAFSNGVDSDHNGFVDDIAGWDFLDDDNDPFDDVQYGHGTGEAKDSSSEADNGGQVGSCPNCMVLPLRVGDSFIADEDRFAAAALYATDNGVSVIQEALGTMNNSSLARDAVDYAYRHGVTVIASAADEAAQHNNWPSSLPHTIVVNSVTNGVFPAPDQQYTAFNGCTNFNAKITLAIPSTSCSSNATGLAAGMAGLIYSAALDAKAKGTLSDYPATSECQRTDGSPCVITPNEVRQLMATGSIGGASQADDVNFASPPGGVGGAEPSCSPVPTPGCTDPNGALQAQVDLNRPLVAPGAFQSYPARQGPDQFYGYGRVNMYKAVSAILSNPTSPAPAQIPPEAEITSPQWFEQVNPTDGKLEVDGQVFARGANYTCDVLVAPGQYPNNALAPTGDFTPVGNGWCDGSTAHAADHSGALGSIDLAALESKFPPGTNFTGPEPQATPGDGNGRPNTAPHSFTIEVVVHSTQNGVAMTGEDRRAAYLEHDADALPGFPRGIRRGAIVAGPGTTDGESSPVLADINGDNRNELIIATSDGFIHAIEPDGSELPGWPVRDPVAGIVAGHSSERAYASGEVSTNEGAPIVASVAVGDTNGDGIPEVYVADMDGHVYGYNPDGKRIFSEEANPAFSGKPLQPFVNSRHGEDNRTQHGFLASPVLADLNGDGHEQIIAAGMDRHLYAWNADGSQVSGFPVLVVDPSKVASIDPNTDEVTFKQGSGALMNGAIVDTPAVGDINGDGKPEIVVGTNEEYDATQDGGWNVAPANTSSLNLLDQLTQGIDTFKNMCGSPCDALPDLLSTANSRLYAIQHDGNRHSGGAIVEGWPAKIGIVDSELLPVVGEGVTGAPIIGDVGCNGGASGPKIGAMANNGAAYVFDPSGRSCYGQVNGEDVPLATDFAASGTQVDHPLVPAVGHPAFANLDGTGLSFVAPAAGLQRALDVVAPEYQPGGQDFIAAWSVTGGGQLRPGFPQPVNDLQFLTGPSISDIDPTTPGQEIVEGTASMDLNAFSVAGTEVPGWPKLSSDWTIANPTIGSFGTLDTASSARKVVIGLTRSGYINAYRTAGPACSPSAWPRFHHDNANSGDYERDATLPGVPYAVNVSKGAISFKAPGDDLLCGRADHYQIVTSNHPIDEGNFDSATPLGGKPAPKAPGSEQSYTPPADVERYVAFRAMDDQGNVGRVADVDFGGQGGPPPGPPPRPHPGHCGRVKRGTPKADVIKGTRHSDKLVGKRGPDRIVARGGSDCVNGGPGADGISGGGGRDRLRGGKGSDRISGGKGKDVVSGGKGRDQIHVRGGKRDVVDCGPGRDTVWVDRHDRVRGCEAVRAR